MVLATRLRMTGGGGGGFIGPRTLPSSWGITRLAGNPIVTVSPGNVNETHEQYTPACVQLPNGDIWVYPKGASTVYAWRSTDGGETFAIQNGSNPVIGHGAGGTWDDEYAVEAAATYDAASDVIHLWYKGNANAIPSSGWAWGHATAPGSTPTVFTKDPANPILTSATVNSDLGGAGVGGDLAISDVIMIDGTFHFYGYCLYSAVYRIIHATGTTWNDPAGVSILLSAPNSSSVVEVPSVVAMPGVGLPLYAMFYSRGSSGQLATTTRVGSSADGVTWDFSDTSDVMAPTSGWEANQVFAGHMLKSGNAPYSDPAIDGSGRWRYYYSGIGGGAGHANAGLAYMLPVF